MKQKAKVKKLNFSKGRETFSKEPDWEKLQQAKTEEEQIAAYDACEYFVHNYITSKEYIHSTKKWIRDYTDWNLFSQVSNIPDVYLASIAKNGWKAYVLGYMPSKIRNTFKTQILSMIKNAETIKLEKTPLIHPSISLDDDNELHPIKVKSWIDYWKKWLAANKNLSDKKEYHIAKHYVSNMQSYLSSGVWLDTHYGEKREKKLYTVCVAAAYDEEGFQKRTKGVYYPDLAAVWSDKLNNIYEE